MTRDQRIAAGFKIGIPIAVLAWLWCLPTQTVERAIRRMVMV